MVKVNFNVLKFVIRNKDICWLIDGEGILVASADHSITLWKNQTLVSTFQSSDNSGSVRCLAPNPLNQNGKFFYNFFECSPSPKK